MGFGSAGLAKRLLQAVRGLLPQRRLQLCAGVYLYHSLICMVLTSLSQYHSSTPRVDGGLERSFIHFAFHDACDHLFLLFYCASTHYEKCIMLHRSRLIQILVMPHPVSRTEVSSRSSQTVSESKQHWGHSARLTLGYFTFMHSDKILYCALSYLLCCDLVGLAH